MEAIKSNHSVISKVLLPHITRQMMAGHVERSKQTWADESRCVSECLTPLREACSYSVWPTHEVSDPVVLIKCPSLLNASPPPNIIKFGDQPSMQLFPRSNDT